MAYKKVELSCSESYESSRFLRPEKVDKLIHVEIPILTHHLICLKSNRFRVIIHVSWEYVYLGLLTLQHCHVAHTRVCVRIMNKLRILEYWANKLSYEKTCSIDTSTNISLFSKVSFFAQN